MQLCKKLAIVFKSISPLGFTLLALLPRSRQEGCQTGEWHVGSDTPEGGYDDLTSYWTLTSLLMVVTYNAGVIITNKILSLLRIVIQMYEDARFFSLRL